MKLKILSFLAIMAASAMGAKAEGTLSIGTEGAYPPWSIADASGNVTGFDADVGALVCAKLQMECKFVVQAFDGLIPALKAERFDIIISGMSITAERQKEISFSIGYAELANKFIVAKDSPLASITDIPELLKALSGHSVGVQAGTTHAHFMEKLVPDATLKSYDSLDQMQIDLASGRVEAGFADISALQDFLAKPEGANFQFVDVNVLSTYDATLGNGVGIGIRQEDTELKAKIDTALCELIKDGSIATASQKWFKMDISRPCE